MRFEIILAPSASRELQALPAHLRAAVRDGIELHQGFEAAKVSKSRIKRLRGLDRPQFRLRIGDTRVFYDVTQTAVEVLAIVPKAQADAWLEEEDAPSAQGSPGKGQG